MAVVVFGAHTVTIWTGIRWGAAGSAVLGVKQLLVAKIIVVGTAVVMKVPAFVLLRKEAKLQLAVVGSTF